jgi:hypothetical protein
MLLLALLLIIAGALATASLIVQKQPNAREAIAKLVPFQGIIGIVLLLWGLWQLIELLRVFGFLMQYAPITALAYLASVLVAIGLGILLGYALIQQYVLSKNADASRSGEAVRAKLTGVQVPLGIAGIALGVWLIVLYMSYRSGF